MTRSCRMLAFSGSLYQLKKSAGQIAMLFGITLLSACSNHETKTGQVIARVNNEDIMAYQLNVELGNAGRSAEEIADKNNPLRKQVLEALIDRQILVGEAIRNKLDRDPNVVQSIERFREQTLAQMYLQSRVAHIEKPGASEIEEYFKAHPELFAQRRSFDIKQLAIATKSFTPEINVIIDKSKSLDEVANLLDQQHVDYVKVQQIRSTADLPGEVLSKLSSLEKGQVFVIKDGAKVLLSSLSFVKDSPVSLVEATPQIERYLQNKKTQQAATAEVSRLRGLAKLEYTDPADKARAVATTNASPANPMPEKSPAVTSAVPPNGALPAGNTNNSVPASNNGLERGIANIK